MTQKRSLLLKNILITLRALEQCFQTYRHIMLHMKHYFHSIHKTKFPSRGGGKILNLTKVLQRKKVENLCCKEKNVQKISLKIFLREIMLGTKKGLGLIVRSWQRLKPLSWQKLYPMSLWSFHPPSNPPFPLCFKQIIKIILQSQTPLSDLKNLLVITVKQLQHL